MIQALLRSLHEYLVRSESDTAAGTFAQAKTLSDFIAFITRFAFLAVLIGLLSAKQGHSTSAFERGFLLFAEVLCYGIGIQLFVLIVSFFTKTLVEAVSEELDSRAGWRRWLFLPALIVVVVPFLLGLSKVKVVAEEFGRQQLFRLEEEGVATELKMPPPPKFD